MIFFLRCSNFSQLSLYDRNNNQYLSSCPYLTPNKKQEKKNMQIKTEYTFMCVLSGAFHSF